MGVSVKTDTPPIIGLSLAAGALSPAMADTDCRHRGKNNVENSNVACTFTTPQSMDVF